MSKPVYLGKGKWGKVEDQMPEDWDFAKNEWKSNKPKLIQWDEVDSYLKKGYIAEEKRDGARMLGIDIREFDKLLKRYNTERLFNNEE